MIGGRIMGFYKVMVEKGYFELMGTGSVKPDDVLDENWTTLTDTNVALEHFGMVRDEESGLYINKLV
jgi:hypothetical protein